MDTLSALENVHGLRALYLGGIIDENPAGCDPEAYYELGMYYFSLAKRQTPGPFFRNQATIRHFYVKARYNLTIAVSRGVERAKPPFAYMQQNNLGEPHVVRAQMLRPGRPTGILIPLPVGGYSPMGAAGDAYQPLRGNFNDPR